MILSAYLQAQYTTNIKILPNKATIQILKNYLYMSPIKIYKSRDKKITLYFVKGNPEGTKYLFVHRYIDPSGEIYIYLFEIRSDFDFKQEIKFKFVTSNTIVNVTDKYGALTAFYDVIGEIPSEVEDSRFWFKWFKNNCKGLRERYFGGQGLD